MPPRPRRKAPQQSRDLSSSRDFAVLAQETEPLIDGSDQILAADKNRVKNYPNWYSILQLDRRSDDLDLILKAYRRLALLLHPDKNRFVFSDHAFRLVAYAWAVLSDPTRKPVFDTELSLYSFVDLTGAASGSNQNKLPVRRGSNAVAADHHQQQQEQQPRLTSFWTDCPYCNMFYEYDAVYEGCCLRCQNCKRGFEAVVKPNLPPMGNWKEAYYCCWRFFPLGYAGASSSATNKGKGKGNAAAAAESFPGWMLPVFATPPPLSQNRAPEPARALPISGGVLNFSGGSVSLGVWRWSTPKKRGRPWKRGRPRKIV